LGVTPVIFTVNINTIMSSKNAIVILNYNGLRHLQTYLPSVIENSPQWDIIVADNGSTDDSLTYLNTQVKQIKTIVLAKNYGYAGGYNEALNQLQGQYQFYFLLNSDVRLTTHWDVPLLDFLKNNPLVAGVQPKVLSDKEPNRFEHAGACGGYLDWFYYPFCRGRVFDAIEEDQGQYNSTQQVTWVSGAAFLIKSEAFHKVNGFDSAFFAHMEEIDLCLRLGSIGDEFYCIPESRVYHLGGGTLDYSSPRKVFLNFRNSLWMIVKNQKRFLLPFLFIRMALDGIAAIQFLVKGKPKLTWQIFLAHLALYRHFMHFYKKRQPQISKPLTYHGFLIWDYFGKAVRHFFSLNKRKFHR
jgi:GT2 family glycosyltransferase